jgi:hypothetical protein
MYKNVLETIQGIGIYPLLSMFIFFALFMGAIGWFFRANKRHLQHMAELPLAKNHYEEES